jgi:hypothetical protein
VDEEDDVIKNIEEREKQRLQGKIDDIEEILEDRGDIHEAFTGELDREISRQDERLEKAQSKDEPRIRGILQDLYRERREEFRENWRDTESLKQRKIELEQELAELEDLDDLL